MVRSAALLTAGPQIVSRALGYDASKFELGGEQVHKNSGIPDNFAESEEDALAQVRRFLSFLPSNVDEPPPRLRTDQPEDSTAKDIASYLAFSINMLYVMAAVPIGLKVRRLAKETKRVHKVNLSFLYIYTFYSLPKWFYCVCD